MKRNTTRTCVTFKSQVSSNWSVYKPLLPLMRTEITIMNLFNHSRGSEQGNSRKFRFPEGWILKISTFKGVDRKNHYFYRGYFEKVSDFLGVILKTSFRGVLLKIACLAKNIWVKRILKYSGFFVVYTLFFIVYGKPSLAHASKWVRKR